MAKSKWQRPKTVGEVIQDVTSVWMDAQMQPVVEAEPPMQAADTWGVLVSQLTVSDLHAIAQLRGISDGVFFADGGPEHFRLSLGLGTIVCGDCLKLDCTGCGKK